MELLKNIIDKGILEIHDDYIDKCNMKNIRHFKRMYLHAQCV